MAASSTVMENDVPLSPSRILTPDQRLRVFVSSTLDELADERRAAREAIERLRLAPVMFELGARPYPPRRLYRAYLEQSQIFVGIYWQRYGWVAPGEDVSGLEDEYDLSGERPKLIYVKRPAAERDERLSGVLRRIEKDDRASYKPFDTPDQLRELLENDLALLLTERFEAARQHVPPPDTRRPVHSASLPIPSTKLIGRTEQIETLARLMRSGDVRLLTLFGPGGIGKTRLALAVAEGVRDAYSDGVVFVPLAAVRDPARVLEVVAAQLRLKLEGGVAALDALAADLHDKQMLLVLDNCEQVVAAAPGVAELMLAAPGLRVIATSRVALRISAEHIYAVPPLEVPSGAETGGGAVQLFLERARAVRVDLGHDPASLRAIAEIVRRLDGLPLAIELAASRTRLLSPQQLLARLERRFDVLDTGPRDLPARQQTLRATLDWSFELLAPAQRHLLVQLGVFMGGFSLEAVDAVVSGTSAGDDALDGLDQLVGHSLVQVLPDDTVVRFGLLETVREYAAAKLQAGEAGDPELVRERHMQYYLSLAEALGPTLKVTQGRALTAIATEHANVRLAIEWSLAKGRYDAFARFAWSLWLYWWIRNEQDRALPWLEDALGAPLDDRARVRVQVAAGALYLRSGKIELANAVIAEALPQVRTSGEADIEALVLAGAGLAALARREYDTAEQVNRSALELYLTAGDAWGVAFVNVALARVALATGDAERAVALAAPLVQPTLAAGDENTAAWVLHVQGLAESKLGRWRDARQHLGDCLELFWRLGNAAGTANVIGSIAGLALSAGDPAGALRLGAAAQAMGDAVGALPFEPERSIFESYMDEARALVGDSRMALESEGRAMDQAQTLESAWRLLREEPA